MASPTRRVSLWDSSSDRTSDDVWIGDAEELSLELRGSPSTTTVQISNDDGFTSSVQTYSDATTVTDPQPDMIDLDPGPRWFRAIRSETTSGVLHIRDRGGFS